jgi:hypothetical protein
LGPFKQIRVGGKNGYDSLILADNPVAYFRLDEVNGTAGLDVLGINTGAYNPTSSGAWTGGTLGQSGPISRDNRTGALFNGTSGYMLITDTALLRLSNNFTIEFWIKLASTGQTNKYVIARNNSVGSGQSAIIYGFVANKFEFFADSYTGTDPRTGSQITVADTNWHHIGYTYDGTTWAGYLDGASVFSTSRTFSLSTASLDGWYIGGANATSNYVNATMHRLAIYRSGLSANAMLARYLAGANGF